MKFTPRRWIAIGIVLGSLLTVGFIVSWIAGHGYLTITVSGSDGDVHYSIRNRDSSETQTITTSNKKFKKLLPKANYEITALELGRNAITQITVKGFLHDQKSNVAIQSEVGRAFVGNNPAPCMYYLGSLLLSYECHSNGGLTAHVPATGNTPTYTQPVPNVSTTSKVVGLVNTPFGNVLISNLYDLDSDTNLQNAVLLDANQNSTDQTILNGTDSSADYSVVAYKSGFLLYSSDLKSVLYYSSLRTQPVSLNVSSGKSGLYALGLQVSKTGLVANYANVDAGEEPSANTKVNSVIVTKTDNETHRYSFDTLISKGSFCGSQLCLLTGSSLDVYQAKNNTLELDHQIDSVNDISSSQTTTLATTSIGIIDVSNNANLSHYAYTFGRYRSCGLSLSAAQPVICLITPKQDKVALLLSGALTDYPIDVSVGNLLGSKQIQTVSTYQTYLYVTPVVGSMVYNSQTNQYGYSAAQKNLSKSILQDQLRAAKLDTATYSVINTLTY